MMSLHFLMSNLPSWKMMLFTILMLAITMFWWYWSLWVDCHLYFASIKKRYKGIKRGFISWGWPGDDQIFDIVSKRTSSSHTTNQKRIWCTLGNSKVILALLLTSFQNQLTTALGYIQWQIYFWCWNNHLWASINPLSANPTKWSNTLKQFAGKLLTNCLSVFDHFVGLAFKGLNKRSQSMNVSVSLFLL